MFPACVKKASLSDDEWGFYSQKTKKAFRRWANSTSTESLFLREVAVHFGVQSSSFLLNISKELKFSLYVVWRMLFGVVLRLLKKLWRLMYWLRYSSLVNHFHTLVTSFSFDPFTYIWFFRAIFFNLFAVRGELCIIVSPVKVGGDFPHQCSVFSWSEESIYMRKLLRLWLLQWEHPSLAVKNQESSTHRRRRKVLQTQEGAGWKSTCPTKFGIPPLPIEGIANDIVFLLFEASFSFPTCEITSCAYSSCQSVPSKARTQSSVSPPTIRRKAPELSQFSFPSLSAKLP